MTGYITDAVLQAAVDAIVRPSPNQSYAAFLSVAVTNANAAAAADLRQTLATRGYSPTLQAAWVDGATVQTRQGLF